MRGSIKTWLANKREFYGRAEVTASYDFLRFGGLSGAWVNERELALTRSAMPPAGRVLDLGCGTGRVAADLTRHGYPVIAIDTARAMLWTTRRHTGGPVVQADAFAPPFADGSFDAVLALRLVFHYPHALPLLGEMARVARPGGRLVFDTYRWTPRAIVALAARRFGGRVFIHPGRTLVRVARRLGLALQAAEHCFLFSPYVYRLLPLPVVHSLARLESVVPPTLRARTFWTYVRTG